VLSGAFLLVTRYRQDTTAKTPSTANARLTAWLLAGWATLVLVLLILEPALWRAHVAHLVVPLALLAALAPPPSRVLLIAAVVVVPISVVQNRAILWPEGYAGEEAAVVARLHSLPADAFVISDDPGMVWRADRHVPGELADPSFLRIDEGDITAASLARAARATDVCGVLVTSREHYGRFPALGDQLRAEGFLAERFGDRITLYARPGCDPS